MCSAIPARPKLSFVDALTGVDGLSYILGLQEAAVVAMADGYAQASGRPGFVNLHTMAGLGHAMGALLNARQANTPLVVTAGQQDTRHVHTGPLLHGELLDIARPAVKWGHEIRHPDEIAVFRQAGVPGQLRRAFGAGVPVLADGRDGAHRHRRAAGGFRDPPRRDRGRAARGLAQALASVAPGRIAILAGDEVFVAGASDEAAQLAEALGATVFGSVLAHSSAVPELASAVGRQPCPARHRRSARLSRPSTRCSCWAAISRSPSSTPKGRRRAVLLPAVSTDVPIRTSRGRTHACELACVGGIRESLARVVCPCCLIAWRAGVRRSKPCWPARRTSARGAAARFALRAESEFRRPETDALGGGARAGQALGRGTPLVDESPATMPLIRGMLDTDATRQYYGNRGAILGWGMGAAVGVSLGLGRQPVVAVIGDGSALYAPQALWTAAHERLPVTFVIVNNRSYDILKNFMKSQHHFASVRAGRFIGMDLDEPPIDFLALAASWGLPARRVERAGEIAAAVEHGIASGLPNLIELPVGTA